MSKNLLTLCFLVLAAAAIAQPKGSLSFETLVHNFGRIDANGPPVSFQFRFKNTSRTASVTLTRVQGSCDCTTPIWPEAPIAPGDSAFIQVLFKPKGYSGPFSKHVMVNTDGDPQAVMLRVVGEVIAPPSAPKPTDYTVLYPKALGTLRSTSDGVSFGQVGKGGDAVASLTLYNPGTHPIGIDLAHSSFPPHITPKLSADVVAPKDSVRLTLTFHERLRKDWGYVHSSGFLATTDPDMPRKRIDLSARIVEDFSGLQDGTPLPAASIDRYEHDFGALAQHVTVNTTFLLANEGKAPLHIRKVKASCGCTAGHPRQSTLAPGERTTIEVTFRSGNTHGHQHKSVSIITNDPELPEIILWISAQVE